MIATRPGAVANNYTETGSRQNFRRGLHKTGVALNLQDWKRQDWNLTDRLSGVEFAGLEFDGPTVRGGICRTGF
jgi:hypothetical protein